jgi:cell division septation protein DedD
MAKKDANSEKENGAYSDSAEIFEDIFKEATQPIEKRKQTPNPATARGRRGPEGKTPQMKRNLARPASARPPARDKGTPLPPRTIIKPKSEHKAKKPISIVKISILLVLLLIVGGAFLNYFGILEIYPALDLFGLGTKEVVKAPPPKRVLAKTPGKAGSPKPKKQGAEKVASGALPPPAVRKKVETPAPAEPRQKLAKVESAAPILQAHEGERRKEPLPSVQPLQPNAETPAPTPSGQGAAQVTQKEATPPRVQVEPKQMPAPVTPSAPAVAPVQPQQVPTTVQPATPPPPAPETHPKAKEELATQDVRPPVVQTQPLIKPAATEVGSSQIGPLGYPYSIYLGSYQTVERAKKAISMYQQEGLSVYWSRVNLGEKGTWYRVFAGYFRSKAEGSDFIAKKELKDAEVKKTNYSVLVGVYSSREEAQQKSGALFNLGFPTYVIPEAQVKFRLYSGAFNTKEGAEENVAELASKGVRSQAVER